MSREIVPEEVDAPDGRPLPGGAGVRFPDILLEGGVAALVLAVTFLYAPFFSDYMIPKTAAVHVLVALLMGIWLLYGAVQGRLYLEWSPLYWPFLAYLAFSLLSLFFAANPRLGGEVLLAQVWFLGLYLLVSQNFRRSFIVTALIWGIVLAGMLVAVLGLLQYDGIHLIPLPAAYGNLPVSTLGNPNFVAHYLEIVIPLTAGMAWIRRRWWERLVLAAIFVTTCIHLILTTSRGGWLATSVGLAVLFLAMKRRKSRWRSKAVLVLVVGALLSPAVELVMKNAYVADGDSLYDRVVQITERTTDRVMSVFDRSDFSISQRRIIWADTIDLIGDHFWLGVGPGNYELFLPAYRTAVRHRQWRELMGERSETAYRAHNDYLEVMAEKGIGGLLAFLWLLATLLWMGWRYVRQENDSFTRGVTAGCLAALCATLVHCLFSFNFQDPTASTHFWLLGGLMVAVNRGNEEADGNRGGRRFELKMTRGGRCLTGLLAVAVALVGGWVGLCIVAGDYYYFRGLEQHRIGHPNRASLDFEMAIDWRPYDFRYHHMLGLVHMQGKRLDAAEISLKRSVELHPNNEPALRLLGRVLLWRGEDGAAEQLRRASQLDPLEFDTYRLQALAYRQQGQHTRAVESWKQALAFKPENAELLNSLGVEYAQDGEFEAAAKVLEQAVQLHPGDDQLQGNLGVVYLSMGNNERAGEALRRAVALAPEQTDWRIRLAQLYLVIDEPDSADVQLRTVLELDPSHPAARSMENAVQRRLQSEER